jgi:hypothetical protein
MRAGDFRRLLWIRLSGQGGDGIFPIASVVFNPDQQNTAEGLRQPRHDPAVHLLGPFVGVFIDRWSRRILTIAPLLKIAFVPLIRPAPLADQHPVLRRGARGPVDQPVPASGGLGRRRLVPAEDLLIANSIATVGGTLALLVGVFLGGKVADTIGEAQRDPDRDAGLARRLPRRGQDPVRPRADDAAGVAGAPASRDPADRRRDVGRCLHHGAHLNAVGPSDHDRSDRPGIMLTLALVVFREQLGTRASPRSPT